MVFVTTTQLRPGHTKAAIGNAEMNGYGCVPIKFYSQEQVMSQILSIGHNLPIPALGDNQ